MMNVLDPILATLVPLLLVGAIGGIWKISTKLNENTAAIREVGIDIKEVKGQYSNLSVRMQNLENWRDMIAANMIVTSVRSANANNARRRIRNESEKRV